MGQLMPVNAGFDVLINKGRIYNPSRSPIASSVRIGKQAVDSSS